MSVASTSLILLVVLCAPFLFVYYKTSTFNVEIPVIEETWWSNKDPASEDKKIYPFRINVSQEVLDDLEYRLQHTRPFTKPLQDNQVYGFNSDLAQEILDHWKTNYDWRKREANINKYPQFITSIQGLNIHFVHYKPKYVPENVKVLPLLISHGWPSSFTEFLNILPKLTTPRKDRKFIFEVVVASIPGFAFSDPAQKPGLGALETALIFKTLMNRLGFEKFYAHGADMAHMILKSMATSFEDVILGFHSNTCVSFHPFSIFKYVIGSIYPGWIKRKSHREFFYPISNLLNTILVESGYIHLQSTKPDTYGMAIDDTPMGMAVQYLEKFSTGASIHHRQRKDGGLKEKYNIDDLLDNIMIYWITKTGTTSFRFYSESLYGYKFASFFCLPVTVPTACARGPYDIVSPDGMIEEVYPNMVYSADFEVGHYFGFENSDLLADDLFESISKMEEVNKEKYRNIGGGNVGTDENMIDKEL